MARRTPGRVQMKTSTTGNGPYTLANPSPALAGKRTVAEAISDGSLVNGDEILYAIVDPLAAGNARLLEVGRGTLNTTTPSAPVLTVVQVYEKSALLTSGGGWGSGTRDVLISPPGAWNTAFLDFANVFSSLQTFQAGARAEYASGKYIEMSDVISQAAIANYRPENNKVPFYIGNLHSGGGSPSGETIIQFLLGNSGAVTFGPKIRETGALETNGGNKYVNFPGGGVVKMTFNCAPPTGWTRINVTGERLGKYATASDTPEATGGSWTLTGLSTPVSATDNTILSIANLPSHSHDLTLKSGGVGGFSSAKETVEANTAGTATTSSVGSGTGHNHVIQSMAISSTGAWRPAYEIIVKASFD